MSGQIITGFHAAVQRQGLHWARKLSSPQPGASTGRTLATTAGALAHLIVQIGRQR